MDCGDWDYFEEQIATLVLMEAVSFPKAIGIVCTKHPGRSANVLLLAAISFVTHIDSYSGVVEKKALAQSYRRYQVIAALAADSALLSRRSRTCNDLLIFWRTTDSEVFS
jgi:hypothetical protein